MKARKGTRHWDYGGDYDPTREKKAIDPERVFDLGKEQEVFAAAVMPHLETVYHDFGQGTSDALGVAWNLRDPAVAADILARDNRVRGTVETTWQKIQEAIIDGEAEGEGIDGIAKRIGRVFTQAKGYRARMIARTETIGASNAASLQAADASGVVGKKTWLAAVDHRTRSTHVSADGQTVDVKKAFNVGASKMMHPGDPAGGASEVVNCRCSMVFVRDLNADGPVDNPDAWLDETPDQRATRVESAIGAAKRDGLETHVAFRPPHAPDGFYRRERLLQQEDILDEFMAKAADVPQEGRAVFSGGLGGAGKGTVLRSDLVDFDVADFFTVDADAIKEAMAARGMMPTVAGFEDLSPMELSALVHEESSQIAARLAARLQATRTNMIYDVTMSSERGVLSRLELLKAAGYDDVEMVFVDIDVETSVTRALARWEEGLAKWRSGEGFGGRYVPPDIIRSHADEVWGSVNRKAFEAVKGQADRWTLVNNVGDAPFVAERGARDLAAEAVAAATDAARVTRTGVLLSEEMPTGLTKDQAAAWFKAKWGKVLTQVTEDVFDAAEGRYVRKAVWKEVDRVWGFETLPKGTQEEMLRFFDGMFSRAPAVADRIPHFGTMTWLKETRDSSGLRLLYKVGRGVQGVASRRKFLGFGSKTAKVLKEVSEAQKAVGWWSTGDGMHIYAHEFGHHVHYTVEEALRLGSQGDMAALKREVIDAAFRDASVEMGTAQGLTTTAPATREWITENLSRYGASNAYETAAESWAEYALMGDKARPFAKAMGRRLTELLANLETP